MSLYVQTNQIVFIPNIPNYAVNSADTGKTMITPQTQAATDVAIALPALQEGLHYRFINGAAAALSGTVAISATGAIIYGNAVMGPNGGVALLEINGATTINFLTAASVRGDTIDLYCDGTNWYVQASSRIAGSITAA